jgi:hypothetical protein
MIANAPIDELLTRGQLRIRVPDPGQAAAVLSSVPWIKSVKQENGYLTIDAPQDSAAKVNQALAEQHIYASELTTINVSLESVFLELTGGDEVD